VFSQIFDEFPAVPSILNGTIIDLALVDTSEDNIIADEPGLFQKPNMSFIPSKSNEDISILPGLRKAGQVEFVPSSIAVILRVAGVASSCHTSTICPLVGVPV